MSVFRCKMCGGTLDIIPNQTTAICEYCGMPQTLPKLDSEHRINLYDRANHFRRSNDFDRAMSIYENIINEDSTDAEAHWSQVLCRYGVEYVEDPLTRKRMPTVNRTQFTSIFDDDSYKSALRYADEKQRAIYEAEAKAINEIQRGILAISQKEAPFDVFICYKETDNNGRRTLDSVLANDLYHQLVNEGFKVFFSRITLEDKLGSAYEPYIFAALNSAKVMVVLGTRPEYFNAVWVKNEWSRYLSLVKQSSGKKFLIPAYRDMDPYDLPEEFSHLQAQDMGKLGFMQDLIRGIKKITEPITTNSPVVHEETAANNPAATPLLKRAYIYLEDGEWQKADEYCERVLDLDPENGEAYLVKLMIDLRCRRKEQLKEQLQPFDDHNTYAKIVRYASDSLVKEMQSYCEYIVQRNRDCELERAYAGAMAQLEKANTEAAWKQTAALFEKISGYKDSDDKASLCLTKAEETRKEGVYRTACRHQSSGRTEELKIAIEQFSSIPDWKDSSDRIADCKYRIEEIKVQKELKKQARINKRKQRIEIMTGAILAVGVGAKNTWSALGAFKKKLKDTMVQNRQRKLEKRYLAAKKRMDSARTQKDFEAVARGFKKISGYQDAEIQYQQCLEQAELARKNAIYTAAIQNQKKDTLASLEKAVKQFSSVPDWEDAQQQISICQGRIERIQSERKQSENKKRAKKVSATVIGVILVLVMGVSAVSMIGDKENHLYPEPQTPSQAEEHLVDQDTELVDDKDNPEQDPLSKYNHALTLLEKGEYQEASAIFEELGDYEDSRDRYQLSQYGYASVLAEIGELRAAQDIFAQLGSYKDSQEQYQYCTYRYALKLIREGRVYEAACLLRDLGDYKDAHARLDSCRVRDFKVGDVVTLGTYEQDNNTNNGQEEIEWIIREQEDDRVLLVSKYILDAKPRGGPTWKLCVMRKWLNSTFLETAFAGDASRAILFTTVANADDSQLYVPEEDTVDQVFLLSEKEFGNLSSAGYSGRTDYAKAQQKKEWKEYKDDTWWLRSTVETSFVAGFGALCVRHNRVENPLHSPSVALGVRPAMWVDALALEVQELRITQDPNTELSVPEISITPEELNELRTKYQLAKTLAAEGKLKEAATLFQELGDYRDSAEIVWELLEENPFLLAEVGGVVTFGTYEQDNDLDNGSEKIEWVVLDKRGSQLLLISRRILDARPWGGNTWSNTNLRNWLNQDFLKTAFTEDEQERILFTEISTPDNQVSGISGGKDTRDRIFLLSAEEYHAHSDMLSSLPIYETAYAKQRREDQNKQWPRGGTSENCWWLRSPGLERDRPAYVLTRAGVLIKEKGFGQVISLGVAPVMWTSSFDLQNYCEHVPFSMAGIEIIANNLQEDGITIHGMSIAQHSDGSYRYTLGITGGSGLYAFAHGAHGYSLQGEGIYKKDGMDLDGERKNYSFLVTQEEMDADGSVQVTISGMGKVFRMDLALPQEYAGEIQKLE